ncbi:LicD family protein [Bifidobacterium sp. ESL0800]|nr:LicD family protein [Bifidobacterium sp. ESL0800]WEV75230.1 LicD family protein [Bifidobacterium sp. ESL0800]
MSAKVRIQYDNSEILRQDHELLQSQIDLLKTYDAHIEQLLWTALRRDGEDELVAKKRIFKNMFHATGSLRLLQLGGAQLLKDFDALCRKNSIDYWINCGTLIGAVRHQGFIPWDDDMDLGMTRDQIQKLTELIDTNPQYSKRFKVSLNYDPYAFCRQIRFMYNDPNNPCFLDLFIYDYAEGDAAEQYSKRSALRESLIDALKALPFFEQWKEHGYVAAGDGHSAQVEGIFEDYRQQALQQHVISEDKADIIMYGMDNWTPDDNLCAYSSTVVFPLKDLSFEGSNVLAPQHPETILEREYGDIYNLPDDMVSHFDHVSRKLFKNQAVLESLKTSIKDPEGYLA